MRQKQPALRTTILLFVLAVTLSVRSAEPDLKGIMQGLLTDTAEIMEGLLSDDFGKVAAGAERIANHPRIPPDQVQLVAAELGPEMPSFKQLDTSVHDLSLSIATAAEAEDRERAATEFQQMLSGCFACHAGYKDRVSAVLNGAED